MEGLAATTEATTEGLIGAGDKEGGREDGQLPIDLYRGKQWISISLLHGTSLSEPVNPGEEIF